MRPRNQNGQIIRKYGAIAHSQRTALAGMMKNARRQLRAKVLAPLKGHVAGPKPKKGGWIRRDLKAIARGMKNDGALMRKTGRRVAGLSRGLKGNGQRRDSKGRFA